MKKISKLALLAVTSLCFTSCYQLFQSRVSLNPDGTDSTLSDIILDKTTISQLTTPAQIFVSNNEYNDCIKISWTPVVGATSYRLERAVKTPNDTEPLSENDFAPIPGSVKNLTSSLYVYGTSYTDYILDKPTYSSEEYNNTYYYRVSAENSVLNYESSVFIQSTEAKLFAPVRTITATAGESLENIELTWEKTTNASRYNLYRSKDSDARNAQLITTVTGNISSYVNAIPESDQGVDFFYYVEAENLLGEKTTSSPIALGYTLVKGAPARVSNVKALTRGNSSHGIKLQWDSFAYEQTTYDGFFSIYRTSSSDKSLTLIKTVDSSQTSYTDTKGIQPNTYYYYRVLAYIQEKTGDKKILKGPLSKSGATDIDSATKKSTAAEGFVLSAPSDLAVNVENNNTVITFSKTIGEQGFPSDSLLFTDSYNTYSYKVYAGNDLSAVDTELSVNLTNKDANTYVANVDSYKFYKVKTISSDGTVESNFSAISAPSPKAPKNTIATKAAFISGYTDNSSMANANQVFPVKITWNAPEGGADGGYYVFRSLKPNAAFQRITADPITKLEYIDKNDSAKAGTYYYYKVLSLNSLNQGTNYSNTDMGYGAITHDQYMREYNKTVQRSQKKLTLMHKSGNTDKLGKETINGDISGTLYYDAGINGLSGRVIMKYTDYVDLYVTGTNDIYFHLDGNTNTSASMDQSGTMDGTVTITGMYPGSIVYDNIKIVGGGAGGGYYLITPNGFPSANVSYTVGNEGW